MHIVLNAFSFLRAKIAQKGFGYLDEVITLEEGANICALMDVLQLSQHDVEAAFVNHKVVPKETTLHENDRVALIPPGTPGSYRLLSGLKED